MLKYLLFTLFIGLQTHVIASPLTVVPVTSNVYALVGETGGRTYDNYAFNNTFGFVVTEEGIVLINSGASYAGGALIEQAIATVSDKPIKWLLNLGAQDHYWLGNGYFKSKEIEIIALKRTVAGQKDNANQSMERVSAALKERAKNTKPVYADKVIDADKTELVLGQQRFELMWLGEGHFANDAVLWLPEQQVLFSGDLIFTQRMLGVQPWSNAKKWQQTFHQAMLLKPKYIIPGHGEPCDIATAKEDTGNYLDWLISNISTAVDDMEEIGAVVERLSDAIQFKHLLHYEGWHKRNINRVYTQLEQM